MNPQLTRTSRLAVAFTAITIAMDASGRNAGAQEPARPDAKDGIRTERLAEMTAVVRSFPVVAIDDRGKETPATLSTEPLHRWTDPTRKFEGGALWVWRVSGRPVAVVGVELYASWSVEFVSVSTGLVKAGDGNVRWSPRKGGVAFQEIPGAPAPAETAAGRFRQMRDLARQFSPRETWLRNEGNLQHYALRLLPHPIDRYSDTASGVVDGGIFVCANGTNPEALLLIEARRSGDGPPKWSFAAASFSHASVSIKLDARDVWTSPNRDTGQPAGPDDSYYDVLVPRRGSFRDRRRTSK